MKKNVHYNTNWIIPFENRAALCVVAIGVGAVNFGVQS